MRKISAVQNGGFPNIFSFHITHYTLFSSLRNICNKKDVHVARQTCWWKRPFHVGCQDKSGPGKIHEVILVRIYSTANCKSRVGLSTLLSMLIHLLDPLDTDRQSSDLDKKMLPCIVKQSNEYLYRIMPFWRRYCLCVWMTWGALRTQENGSLRALNFKFSWGRTSLVGANH